MPRIRKKDADQKRKLLKWFKSKEGQESLKKVQDEAMVDPYGRPINVMLPEAEVSTLGKKERDLTKDALGLLGKGAFETARTAPVFGDAIDIAEVLGSYITGKDLYGDEVNPNAQFGLTAAGLLIPNILERPVKYLLKKGAKNVDDIKRILREGPDSPELQPLEDLQKKAKEFQRHVYKKRGLDKVHENVITSKGLSTWGSAPQMEEVAATYLMERNPDLLMDFSPDKFDAGMYDKSMRDFADNYLTSFRSVGALNEENARKYLTDAVGTGSGGRNLGPGLYQSDATAQKGGGSFGEYLGAIRASPEVGGSFDDATRILKDIQAKEFQGVIDLDNFKTDGMTVHEAQEHLHNMRMLPGMKTNQNIRVTRSGEGVNLLDMSSGRDANKDLLSKYDSDYFGASYNPHDLRGVKGRHSDEINPNYFSKVKGLGFDNGGKFKVKKKAQEGMKVKKSNGDPPKGYTRDADGYLTPIGFNEFHEEGGPGQDPTNYLNLYKLDSILESSHDGSVPFGAFRDAVRRVEAGPNSEDPYTQRQEVEVIRNNKKVKLPVGVGRGAYQFDYPSAQTAYTRLKSIADKRDLDYPDLSDDDLRDVSKLDPEIQDMLFTAHFAKDKKTSVASVLDSEDNWADQYQIGHYKGEKDRRDHFRSLQ